jgi:hypothetical protein
MRFFRSRWSRTLIGTGTVLGAVSALGVFVTAVAGAPSRSGKLSVTGGMRGFRSQQPLSGARSTPADFNA